MLRSGAEEFAETAPWVPIFPGLAISMAVFRLQHLWRRGP